MRQQRPAAGPGAGRNGRAPHAGALPPRLRPVLGLLLAGLSEKQAAAALGLSRHTVHQYVKTLYKLLGVNSRAQLMALWLGTRPAAPRAARVPRVAGHRKNGRLRNSRPDVPL